MRSILADKAHIPCLCSAGYLLVCFERGFKGEFGWAFHIPNRSRSPDQAEVSFAQRCDGIFFRCLSYPTSKIGKAELFVVNELKLGVLFG